MGKYKGGNMKFKIKEVFDFLQLFADKAPHKFLDQYTMYMTLYKKDMIKITRWAMHNKFIVGVGRNFLKLPLGLRTFILTEKGDDMFRDINIRNGADRMHYKYFDRETAKYSDEGIDPITIKDAQIS